MEQLNGADVGGLELMCDWGFIVPVVAALCFVVLGGLFCKVNFIDDEGNMDGYIRTGGDKTDADDFQRFRRRRKHFYSSLIITAIIIVALVYILFLLKGVKLA